MNKYVVKVVGTHALINGLAVAAATVLIDLAKLVKIEMEDTNEA